MTQCKTGRHRRRDCKVLNIVKVCFQAHTEQTTLGSSPHRLPPAALRGAVERQRRPHIPERVLRLRFARIRRRHLRRDAVEHRSGKVGSLEPRGVDVKVIQAPLSIFCVENQ